MRVARRVFFSFHYDNDAWRVQQIQKMGVLEGQPLLSPQKWEEVKRQGDAAIKKWIANQMSGKSCVVVLIGSATASRKWVKYEIEKGWDDRKGVVGIYIHKLLDSNGKQSTKGSNPFSQVFREGMYLSSIVKAYDPPFSTSTYVYDHIKANIEGWVDEAIRIRAKY